MTEPTYADGGGTTRRGDPSKEARPKPLADLLGTPEQSRHHDPVEIGAVYRSYGYDRQAEVLAYCRRLDSGRFWTFLDDLHRWLAHLDFDGRDHAEEILSEDLLAWVKLYGYVEDLNTFPRMEPTDWGDNVQAAALDVKQAEDSEVME